MNSPQSDKQISVGGFTLIEVMIAITLMGMMMATVYQILDDSLDTKTTVVKEDREFTQVERTLQRIQLDFMEIYSPLYYSHRTTERKQNQRYASPTRTQNRDQSENSGPKVAKTRKFPDATHNGRLIPKFESPDQNTFIFFTSSNQRKMKNSKESRYAWVRLGLESMEEGPSPERSGGDMRIIRQYYTHDIYSPEHNWDAVKKQTLLQNVKEFTIEYWNPVRNEWSSSLEELNENRFRLSMIHIHLKWVNPDGNVRTIERSFRHKWPHYDHKIDQAAHRKAKRPQESQDGPANNQNPNQRGNRQ